jgi:protein-disulfide isomerase
MKKKIVWGIIIFLTLLVISLLLLKSFWQEKTVTNNISAISEAKAESFVPAASPTVSADEKIIGSIQAPVKILVYEDYNNLFSAELAANLDKIKAEFGDEVVIAVRPYVLRDNAASMEAAMAIECSMDGGKWADMRNVIFSAVTNNDFSTEKIAAEVEKQGLDKAKFTQCLTSLEKQGLMLQVAENAKDFSVYGAPTTFIGNELVIGARPYEDYQDETGAKVEGLKSLVERQIK